jgi:Ca2+-binding RTX toxin-like protein
VNAGAGDDTVYGSAYNDTILGEDGNDTLFGLGGNDFLFGGAGNDKMYGGVGDDTLAETFGDDILNGEAGNDRLWGGSGNDSYIHQRGGGFDTINDAKSPQGTVGVGYGGGSGDRITVDYAGSEFVFLKSATNDLVITTASDLADGSADEGVLIEGFFNKGGYLIEYISYQGGSTYLPGLFGL